MSDVVIRVENLSKHYRLGQIGGGTLREDLQSWWAGKRGRPDPLQKLDAKPTSARGEHWALRDVSFDVRQGEVLGIIGRNGAGKSTLLKILSRTTAPTTGSVRIKGRIASLLEVGTGFHPELSGRENIYLNGAILGMKKAEIDRKLDEIIDFSGIEAFIDTPVKRYSSGMYVRLAFSVAAHLEPEILVVDEVLAVGDMAFQKKCLGKLDSVSKHGRTVLFVSHNMATLSNLCKTGLFMHEGRLDFQGNVSEAVIRYYKDTNRSQNSSITEFRSDAAELLGFELIGLSGLSDISVHDQLVVRMNYKIKKQMPARCVPNFHFFSSDGSCVFVSAAQDVGAMKPGCFQADCVIPADLMNEGAYFVGVALTTHLDAGTYNVEFYNQNALTFNVVDPMEARSNRYSYSGPMPGVVRPKLAWAIKEL